MPVYHARRGRRRANYIIAYMVSTQRPAQIAPVCSINSGSGGGHPRLRTDSIRRSAVAVHEIHYYSVAAQRTKLSLRCFGVA